MFKHLLVPLDGSELSERAAEVSLALAAKLDARVTAFVIEPPPPLPSMSSAAAVYARQSAAHDTRTAQHAQGVLDKFRTQAAALGVAVDGHFARNEGIEDAIEHAAAAYGCDLIVMITHGRGLFGELLFGSHTKKLVGRTRLPVLVLH
ncbi:MAG: universal stress protein [Burkholderiales bacterium]|nr:universal stress protein [Burkholderiales bacterium]